MEEKKRGAFSGSLGFVLAAAGSAVGLGNLWRFPYLAAKNGGGLFLVIYIVLALTFGFTMLTTEIAIGRKTKQSPLTAYGRLHSKFKFTGVLACLIPFLILPYYCAIGGWVLKYFIAFVTGNGAKAANGDYFGGFITSFSEPIILMLVFFAITAFIVFAGVDKGIESFSKICMPALLILVIGISIYSLTLKSDATGTVRTGLQGLAIYLIPNFDGLTVGGFFSVLMDAMGQLFFSLSVAMGIMIAYGSYVSDDTDLKKSVNQIELCDTGVAFLAGVMIIPAVCTFMGPDVMKSTAGPGLMFVALPQVFQAMGVVGNFIGALFFAMVFFAALTSSVSIMEAVVSSFMDQFGWSRKGASCVEGLLALILGVVVCLGYNKLYFEFKLPNGSVAQILDIMDYISNNLFMPIVALAECVLVGWVLGPSTIEDEITKSGCTFGRKTLYELMVKFIAPILLFILFLRAAGVLTII
ncbi:MAG: sodium-dependent transporter [Lachnospiraceae bacterium]|jgi:NSS family neurotransmitter:Na+ symporter|nr:sodium-dependent transporter [Lachnospiraceae bacterium]